MPKDEIFQETVTRVEKPSSHFTLLRAPKGISSVRPMMDLRPLTMWTIRRYGTPSEKAIATSSTGLVVEVESPRSKDGDYLRHGGKWLASDGYAWGCRRAVRPRTRSRTPAVRISEIVQGERMGLRPVDHRARCR